MNLRHTLLPWRLTLPRPRPHRALSPFFGPRSPFPFSSPTMTPPVRMFTFLSLLFSLLLRVSAQSTSASLNSTITSSSTPTPTPSSNLTTFLATSSYTTTVVSQSGSQNIPFTTVLPTVYNVTSTLPSPTASSSATPSPTPIILATEITPAFGVLGAILILTGLPSAFWGHKNRWWAVSPRLDL